jgi:hypothetical protein
MEKAINPGLRLKSDGPVKFAPNVVLDADFVAYAR